METFCITGIGMVTGHGTGGREAALAARRRILAGEGPCGDVPLDDPDYSLYLGPRGLRLLSRGTLSVLAAARLALADAGLPDQGGAQGTQAGVVIGSAAANAGLVADFDRVALKEGPMAVNPALFPQTVWNSPSSQIAIRFGLIGANLTVCAGLAGGLHAVLTALLLLRRGRERVVLAGGFEELSPLYRVLFGAGEPGMPAGMPLSEGAVVLVLEERSLACERGASPLAVLAEGVPAPPARAWRLGEAGAAHGGPEGCASVDLYRAAGCGGGMSGALAAALAARGEGAPESVVAQDGDGRFASLLVSPLP